MNILAVVAVRNEAAMIASCIRHLAVNGVQTYVIDDGSTDDTADVARRSGIVGLERRTSNGIYHWEMLLVRKLEIMEQSGADWLMHVDADERPESPWPSLTLQDAFTRLSHDYNVVHFLQCDFLPTREHPVHSAETFYDTMRWYQPIESRPFSHIRAWQQPIPEEREALKERFLRTGGHQVVFPSMRMHPQPFILRHYPFLSLAHAIKKYGRRRYDQKEVARGWHRGRANFAKRPFKMTLPSKVDLREDTGHGLDLSNPFPEEFFIEACRQEDRHGR